jgi:hypothetical protein
MEEEYWRGKNLKLKHIAKKREIKLVHIKEDMRKEDLLRTEMNCQISQSSIVAPILQSLLQNTLPWAEKLLSLLL